ncbi:hypothetical protein [Phocaeicola sp.]
MKTTKLLGILWVSFFTICFTACSDDEQIDPIRFPNYSYDVRMMLGRSISFVDGSGDYTINIENPEILDAAINSDIKSLQINPKQKGETTVSITDNKAKSTVELKLTVTDFYIGFKNVASNHSNPILSPDTFLFLVNNDTHDFYLYDKEENITYSRPLNGSFEFKEIDSEPYLILHYRNYQNSYEEETIRLNMVGEYNMLRLMNRWFKLGWGDYNQEQSPRMSMPPTYYLYLRDNGYDIAYLLQPDTYLPTGYLK